MTAKPLTGKNIILGVTGGIAAYKSAELARGLIKAGAQVRVVMTEGAKAFITPLTFQALTGYEVSDSLLDEKAEQGMGHIELARWADGIVIAPATADFIARLNAGMANDLLSTLCLATTAPITLAPAMNEKMWLAPATARNMRELRDVYPNLQIIGPDAGEQACGDVGPGRMSEPAQIVDVLSLAESKDTLRGKRFVLTAGPTQEQIDPVRYLSNNSSGKMGFALAKAAADAGAEVCLIAGPVNLPTPSNVNRINVTSAQEMLKASLGQISQCDIFIGTAAVADYRPTNFQDQKMKKNGDNADLTIQLTENPDIISSVANHSNRPTTVIAFAAETQNIEEYAQTKLKKKSVDAVVANDVSRSDIGFGSDNNEVIWVDPKNVESFGPASKQTVAQFIIEKITSLQSSQSN